MVIYEKGQEKLGDPSLKLDGETQDINIKKIANIVSNLTGIDSSKLEYFFKNFGINVTLNNPSLIGVGQEQEKSLKELKELLSMWGEYNEPIRYR